MKLLLALLLAQGSLHGSILPWLGGTRPYETVPYREMDLRLKGDLAPNYPSYGIEAVYGITDHWTAELGARRIDSLPGDFNISWGSQLRFLDAGACWIDLGAAYSGVYSKNDLYEYRGQDAALILSKELFDNLFSCNLGWDFTQREPFVQGGWKSPYWIRSIRLAVDGTFWSRSGAWTAIPQLEWNLPGDLSFQVGVSISDGPAATRWLLKASYVIFPSP